MATLPALPSPSLQLSTASTTHFPSPRASVPLILLAPPNARQLSFTRRATTNDESNSDTQTPTEPESTTPDSVSDPFESRLSKVRLRYRSGTGKKAEVRKSKKGISKSVSGGMYLPPVPLKVAESVGLKVEFGFSPYSERVNGRIAILGLSALLLVEMATGKSVINYHTPAIVLIQFYFVAAVSALYVKYEKEKVSVWPESSPNPAKD